MRVIVPMMYIYTLKKIVDGDTRKFFALVVTSIYAFIDVAIIVSLVVYKLFLCTSPPADGICSPVSARDGLLYFTLAFFIVDAILIPATVGKLQKDVNKYVWRPRRPRSLRYRA